ncbi:MAG: hypothetical protein ACKOYC_09370 [Bacteroidota bacterium]
MKTIIVVFATILLTSFASKIHAQSNAGSFVQQDSSVPNPNSEEKAAQIQNAPYVIDDNGQRVYFLVNPSTKNQPIQRPEERQLDTTGKGVNKSDPE